MENLFFTFLTSHATLLLEKTIQQIYLTLLAVMIAMLIGIPLGIVAYHHQKIKSLILSIANILQTIPSLALLAFLLPFFGIGVKPAIIALSLYSLLPIVRNTVTGLDNVASDVKEAADGLGFTQQQKLWLVEFPLAIPTIIAGIRIATAMSVGIATLAALIGAGGLGDFIYQGISLNDNRLVLLGAIPAALLALFFDFVISLIERAFSKHKIQKNYFINKFSLISIISVLIIMISGYSIFSYFNYKKNTIVVASKNFTEEYILADMIADMIEAKTSLNVEKKLNLGPTAICHHAILKGDIDIYPEYTGTAYTTVLNLSSPGTVNNIYQQVKNEYQQKFNLIWLSPFGFNDTQAIVVRQRFAQQHHLQTISNLVPIANQLTIGVPAEFIQRQDAFLGLKNVYNLAFGSIRQMDPGLMYDAIKNKQVDVIMAFSTDSRINSDQLVILQDDKHLFPPYYAAPVIRAEILQKHPEIVAALAPLANLIDDKTMQQLNYEVDIEKQSPDAVAKQFLQSKHLI